MTDPISLSERRGSLWHRWEPHTHTPGTALNDQFGGNDPWADFFSRVEMSAPAISALGITDYFGIDKYEQIRELHKQGRLSRIPLIFPNVEMRFAIETARSAAINFHLLFSPDDPKHCDLIRRFLSELSFRFQEENYRCIPDDLVRLGRAFNRSINNDKAALREGVNQFKVNFDELRAAWKNSAWVQENALVAVAGGGTDGTAGLSSAASFGALRREVESFADIIFSSHSQQRDFWLGLGALGLEELKARYRGPKPCLHGSDAHRAEKVGAPDLDRFCWIKGDLTFESLRQACIEPGGRAFVGPEPPSGALPSQTISQIVVSKASFLKTPSVPLNAGLVAIIGARGSGKTALADFIAAGGYAFSPRSNDASFLRRAGEFLTGVGATLTWDSAEKTESLIADVEAAERFEVPRVQYLSQQFVDQLCSAEGLEDELLAEIERVIFQACQAEDRMGCSSFRELLATRASRPRSARERQQQALENASRTLAVERGRKAQLDGLTKQWTDKKAAIEKDRKERKTLVDKSIRERAQRFEELSLAVDEAQRRIQEAQARLTSLRALHEEIRDVRSASIPKHWKDLQKKYSQVLLSSDQWKSFRLAFVGDVDSILVEEVKGATSLIVALSGPSKNETGFDPKAPPSTAPLIPSNADLSRQTLSLLNKELSRLKALVGIDTDNSKKFKRLSDKISRDESALAVVAKELELARSAQNRINELIEERKAAYERIFDAIIDEQAELSALYQPLRENLNSQGGELGKLAFSIRRTVDLEKWAIAGEQLLDLRELGPFKGKGTLLEVARNELLPAWLFGSATSVAKAMAEFRSRHENHLLEHTPVKRTDVQAFSAWAQRISEWLYNTSHISVSYGLQYDGVDIEQLSPGTRGIVMLLLYVAIDTEDDRPLVIDQPEENLDPKSIHDELVERFRSAKKRRQIVIITHNANLVVNTDADQVIIANCGPHRPGLLPELSYESGGLENPLIRKNVCEILEGGEAAFRERARRLRVRI